jgi:hypothetical protein
MCFGNLPLERGRLGSCDVWEILAESWPRMLGSVPLPGRAVSRFYALHDMLLFRLSLTTGLRWGLSRRGQRCVNAA